MINIFLAFAIGIIVFAIGFVCGLAGALRWMNDQGYQIDSGGKIRPTMRT